MTGHLADLGEFGLIRAITARFPGGEGLLVGPGDDAALLAAPDGRVVATTDLLLEGRHFRRDYSSGYDVGRKAAAQNLSDVVAMGARPTGLLVGFAAPGDLPVDWALRLADGLRDECAEVGAYVAGGDVSSADRVLLAITALGDLGGAAPVLRGGARPGDRVVLAGRLGWAQAGLELLDAGADGPVELLDAHRRPSPPYAAGQALAAAGATAMCDVSDGLLADVGHVATASGVRVELRAAALDVAAPLRAAAERLAADPLRWVLTGGDDNAFVACLPPTAPLPPGTRLVGEVTEGSGVVVDGAPYAGAQGWDHYPRG
ncbi:thiamine-phosphate kinase [Frankia sp. CNm7]|uniref:Thiamine-monophosphate kinase n=1 Tax=Frankia nepalensis TaxID=1836974 RepID=A0A937RLU9_9ACTN|nr:thiamine-phosphate kinase [Frankia nepalensis]MBL7497294.1 thiamine-phosphate kinase [Frankia nepalensis]MBL7515553.1 thiamine-phosphate kinase [Frankia nepalensis]MBL7520934.1 thiamine-phosphate kinase [Frankia nepalensis]MBL7631204.1 thiamine-phosphate kinase [Frankia nepalensis]